LLLQIQESQFGRGILYSPFASGKYRCLGHLAVSATTLIAALILY